MMDLDLQMLKQLVENFMEMLEYYNLNKDIIVIMTISGQMMLIVKEMKI